MVTHHHNVSTFQYNASAKIAPAGQGDRIEVTHSGREYVTVLSTAERRSLDHAAAALQGFVQLAARGASCEAYSDLASGLVEMIRAGAVSVPEEIRHIALAPAERGDETADEQQEPREGVTVS